MPLFLGLDIGTTSTVGILIDAEGCTLSVASRPATLQSSQANWAEEEPEEWWQNAGQIVRELMSGTEAKAQALAGIGVTGMLPAVILLDAEGRPVRRSIQQNDARALDELERFRSGMAEAQFVDLTGTGYSQQLVGPKIMWLKTHEPEQFRRARHVVGASDYITSRLTATIQVEHNWALESGFVNIATGTYDARLLELSGTEASLLPAIRQSHELVGEITKEAAAHLGIRPGVPVVAGCADHVASAFVCGASLNGDLVIKFGGSADILLASDKPVKDRRLYIDHHMVPGLYFTNGCMAAGGNLLNWIVGNLAGGEDQAWQSAGMRPHQWLDRLAATSDTELLFLPYVLGEKTPLMDPYAKGTLVGLGLHHNVGDIWRAALEGIVFGMRHHVDVFTESGLGISRVFAADGGAASDLWLEIAADVLERPVRRIARHPGSCLGAAFLAAKALGAAGEWSRIADYVEEERIFEPRAERSRRYLEKYALWRETYERFKTLYPRVHSLANFMGSKDRDRR
jgi:xylulokinase